MSPIFSVLRTLQNGFVESVTIRPIRHEAKRYEDRKDGALRNGERRFGLCGRQSLEGFDLLESLHDCDEGIEVQDQGGADRIDRAPVATEVEGVSGWYGAGQDHERQSTQDMGRTERRGGKEKTSDACGRRRYQEDQTGGPQILSADHAAKRDKTRDNRNQANCDVE